MFNLHRHAEKEIGFVCEKCHNKIREEQSVFFHRGKAYHGFPFRCFESVQEKKPVFLFDD